MAPNISIRQYIRWLPDQPSEPTNTIVLTSAENRFVDVRILNPSTDSDAGGIHERKVATIRLTLLELINLDVLPFSRLDWAFAGTSSTELKTEPNGKQLVHSKWRHWVDSRHAAAEAVNDEGDMIPQGDGTTLERGSMVNPAAEQMTPYEECWKDLEPIRIKDQAKGVCVALQLHDDANKARGMVVRVGQCCQGLIRVGEHLALERWVWSQKDGWTRKFRMGDLWLPCGVALEEGHLRKGGEVAYGAYAWKVVELSEF